MNKEYKKNEKKSIEINIKKNDLKRLTINDFSFLQAREKTKRYKGSIADAVIEERRNEL